MTTPYEPTTCFLSVACIQIPKGFPAPNRKRVAEIAQSFTADGQLQPIGVRKAEQEGQFILVFGRHRLEAAKMNETPIIECKIFDFDEEEAEAARLAENLFRNPQASKAERLLALGRWSEIYRRKHPETKQGSAGGHGKARARKQSSKKEPAQQDSQETKEPEEAPEVDSTSDDSPIESTDENTRAFHDVVADTTGSSRASVKFDAWLVNRIGQENLEILAAHGTEDSALRKLAKIKDDSKRDIAIKLVAGGMKVDEAIAEAMAPSNATVEDVGDPNAPQPKPDSELTDEEWLDRHCGDAIKRLTYTGPYKRDAILYRHTIQAREKFRGSLKNPLAQARKGGETGPFHYALTRTVYAAHPKHWKPCFVCGGSGNNGMLSRCQACHGVGYNFEMEHSR